MKVWGLLLLAGATVAMQRPHSFGEAVDRVEWDEASAKYDRASEQQQAKVDPLADAPPVSDTLTEDPILDTSHHRLVLSDSADKMQFKHLTLRELLGGQDTIKHISSSPEAEAATQSDKRLEALEATIEKEMKREPTQLAKARKEQDEHKDNAGQAAYHELVDELRSEQKTLDLSFESSLKRTSANEKTLQQEIDSYLHPSARADAHDGNLKNRLKCPCGVSKTARRRNQTVRKMVLDPNMHKRQVSVGVRAKSDSDINQLFGELMQDDDYVPDDGSDDTTTGLIELHAHSPGVFAGPDMCATCPSAHASPELEVSRAGAFDDSIIR